MVDIASWATIFVTVVLFGIALVEKGFTHDILLEAAVFLVSAKLVIATHKNDLSTHAIEAKLDSIERGIEGLRQDQPAPPPTH